MFTARVDQSAAPHAVLDTNVGVTIYSWHDLVIAGDRLIEQVPAAGLDHPDLAYRRRRARSAFLLMLFLNEREWKVLVPLNEFQRTLMRHVSPDSAMSNFTRVHLHFFAELLPDWEAGGDLADDAGIEGNEVDFLCLSWAEQHRIPLISWEGETPSGPNPKKLIPREAMARGIDLVTPEQLLQRHQFDPDPAITRFFSAWGAREPEFVKGRPDVKELMESYVRPFFGIASP